MQTTVSIQNDCFSVAIHFELRPSRMRADRIRQAVMVALIKRGYTVHATESQLREGLYCFKVSVKENIDKIKLLGQLREILKQEAA